MEIKLENIKELINTEETLSDINVLIKNREELERLNNESLSIFKKYINFETINELDFDRYISQMYFNYSSDFTVNEILIKQKFANSINL